jgi:hypothetical protein
MARLLMIAAALFAGVAIYLAATGAYTGALANGCTAAVGVLTARLVSSGREGPSVLLASTFLAALVATNVVLWLAM